MDHNQHTRKHNVGPNGRNAAYMTLLSAIIGFSLITWAVSCGYIGSSVSYEVSNSDYYDDEDLSASIAVWVVAGVLGLIAAINQGFVWHHASKAWKGLEFGEPIALDTGRGLWSIVLTILLLGSAIAFGAVFGHYGGFTGAMPPVILTFGLLTFCLNVWWIWARNSSFFLRSHSARNEAPVCSCPDYYQASASAGNCASARAHHHQQSFASHRLGHPASRDGSGAFEERHASRPAMTPHDSSSTGQDLEKGSLGIEHHVDTPPCERVTHPASKQACNHHGCSREPRRVRQNQPAHSCCNHHC